MAVERDLPEASILGSLKWVDKGWRRPHRNRADVDRRAPAASSASHLHPSLTAMDGVFPAREDKRRPPARPR
jgi:hypothetical protein